MAKNTKKKVGVGAVCRASVKFMHPSQLMRDKFVNITAQMKLSELIALRQEVKTVARKQQMCLVFRHDNWPNKEVYCCKRWATVLQEGDPNQYFDMPTPALNEDLDESNPNEDTHREEIDPRVFQTIGTSAEDIAHVRSLGLGVDDDNEPAPENIPTNETLGETNQQWGWDGIDQRNRSNFFDVSPVLQHRLPNLCRNTICGNAIVHLFLILFPRRFLEEMVLESTNKNLQEDCSEITFGELLRFIGLWFFLATTSGFSRRDYFSSLSVNVKFGAPYRLNQYMSRNRFEQILQAISYTNKTPPSYLDRFWEVRDIIKAWNDNMENVFKTGYITCLDESMSSWMNRWTCPGWMFVPRKPRPFGNEYHTICCGLSGILFGMELVEGKDRPKELPSPPQNRKTTELLLNLCKSMAGTGKIVVLDSGFCVLLALIELKKIGVFAHAVIKKRRYWPKYIRGEEIENHFKAKEIGAVDCLRGELKNEPFNVFVMKEPEYTMKLMATYGSLTYYPEEKIQNRHVADNKHQFRYAKPFSDHFKYRHLVDDHNNLRHSSPSFEDTWVTHRWPNRVFAFLLAVTEVNLYLWLRFKVWSKSNEQAPTLHQFRKQLAFALINNKYIKRDEEEKRVSTRSSKKSHEFRTCPNHARKFEHGKWDLSAKAKYQQHVCKSANCHKQTRTYCSCCPGQWMCKACFHNHLEEVFTSDSSSH